MEELKALVAVVSKNKVKQIDVIGNRYNSDYQVQKLYEYINEGKVETEEQISELFFKGKKNALQYSKRLENKLIDRLTNTIFFIDINQRGFNEYNKALYSCYKDLNAVKILIGRFARKAAIPLAERTLKKALKFDLTDIIVLLAQELRTHYGTFEGNAKKFLEYDKLVEKYTNILVAEIKAESYYAQIRLHFAKAKGSKPEIAKDAQHFANELRKISEQNESYKIKYFYFLIESIFYEITNDYENLLKVGLEALAYFEVKKEMVPVTILFSFSLRVFVSYIKLRKYKQAWQSSLNCLELAKEGSPNWFITLEYCIILSLHSQQFQDAYVHYQKAMMHPDFNKQYEGASEHWHIHEAYIYYLISIGKIDPDAENPTRRFRLARFINEVPSYSKDKRGANISIIILQILLLLQQKKYGEIIDKMESLQTYTQRYLRRDDTYRSNCFIQMLLTLPEGGFHKKAVIRKAEKFVKKLHELPLIEAKQNVEVEIVPYEILWEFVLESLDEKWH